MFRNTAIPIVFFLVALFLDNVATALGTAYFTVPEREANPVVVWVWEVLGLLRWAAPFLWATAVLLVGFILYKGKMFMGIWWFYAVGAGHTLGFLSWTPLHFVKPYSAPVADFIWLFGTLLVSAGAGIILTKLHIRLQKSKLPKS